MSTNSEAAHSSQADVTSNVTRIWNTRKNTQSLGAMLHLFARRLDEVSLDEKPGDATALSSALANGVAQITPFRVRLDWILPLALPAFPS